MITLETRWGYATDRLVDLADEFMLDPEVEDLAQMIDVMQHAIATGDVDLFDGDSYEEKTETAERTVVFMVEKLAYMIETEASHQLLLAQENSKSTLKHLEEEEARGVEHDFEQGECPACNVAHTEYHASAMMIDIQAIVSDLEEVSEYRNAYLAQSMDEDEFQLYMEDRPMSPCEDKFIHASFEHHQGLVDPDGNQPTSVTGPRIDMLSEMMEQNGLPFGISDVCRAAWHFFGEQIMDAIPSVNPQAREV